MELIREWLLGLTAAAFIAGLATAITPSGKPGRAVKLAAGLLIVAAMLRPLLDMDAGLYTDPPALTAAGDIEEELRRQNDALLKAGIEEKAAAYISDKAAELGFEAAAEAAAEKDGGGWRLWEVKLEAECGEAEREALAKQIEAELGVPRGRQYWSGDG